MSGTSLDGVDVALLHTDGQRILAQGAYAVYPYGAPERALLRHVLDDARGWDGKAAQPPSFAQAESLVTQRHIEAVQAFLAAHTTESVQLIGFHGQTILHRPQARLSIQLGDAGALAQSAGIPVMADFRQADIAAGGQGAPFAPLYHSALAAHTNTPRPLVVLNLGGVANLTWLSAPQSGGQQDIGQQDIMAFDVGPGNALLDDWMQQHMGVPYDKDGALAAAGAVQQTLLASWLADDWFARPPPKSLDRLDFACPGLDGLSAADGAATLTAFSAAAIARAQAYLPAPARQWLLCGGGQYNPTLCAAIAAAVGAPCVRAQDQAWPGTELEAQAFAYLAVRAQNGLPLSLPSTTAVPYPVCGGRRYAP